MKRSCVVVGGGISGMSAALLLAGQGVSVHLLEKSPHLAPLVRGFSRKGLHFNTGFHHTSYLEPGDILDRVFKLIGVTGLETFALGQDDDQKVLFRHDSTVYAMPSGYDNVRVQLGDLFPTERAALAKYLELVEDERRRSPYLNTDGEAARSSYDTQTSLDDVLRALFQDSKLRALLASQSLFHGNRPHEVPFAFHAVAGAAPLRSLRGVRGGGLPLVLAFEKALAASEVRITTGIEAVHVLLTPAGECSGVLLADGTKIEADSCIITTHPSLLAKMVPPGTLRSAYLRRVDSMPETPGAFMLFGFMENTQELTAGASWLSLPGEDPGSWFGDKAGTPGSLFASVASGSIDSRPAAIDIASCTGWSALSARQRANKLAEFYMECFPELAANTVLVESADTDTFVRFVNSPFGSFYGLKHSLDYPPLSSRTRIKRLFLAGQSIVAPGVAGAVISACVTCDLALGGGVIIEEIRRC